MAEKFECVRCGRARLKEWVSFPPSLERQFETQGAWYEQPCVQECELAAEIEEWEEERRKALAGTLRERSGVSQRLDHCTLDNFRVFRNPDARAALTAVELWLESWPANRDAGRGMFLSGDVGTGKTHLAVAAMRDLQEDHGVPALMMSVPDLLDSMRAEFDGPGDARGTMIDQAKTAELLVLDDLGSEKASAWSIERLFVVIDYRYRNLLPTIYTSNLGLAEIKEVLGSRIASRLIESNEWVFIEGRDYRKEGAKIAEKFSERSIE